MDSTDAVFWSLLVYFLIDSTDAVLFSLLYDFLTDSTFLGLIGDCLTGISSSSSLIALSIDPGKY